MRRCAKTICSEPATATVVLRYGERMVWLRELLRERDPNFLELCASHADRMTVPVGWTRLDERVAAPGKGATEGETGPPRRPEGLKEPAGLPIPVAAAGAPLLPLG